jgi:diadenosine tetraphosphate (Ap4A) HIT family hydrolase
MERTLGVEAAACPICGSNRAADEGDDPWFVARLSTGYVRLARTQYYRGATFFAARACVAELHDLVSPVRQAHLMEMADVAAAVFDAFSARKMNYEALGNSEPHLHWWLTPRPADDPLPEGPIWMNPDFLEADRSGGAQPDGAERDELRELLLGAIEARGLKVERAFR